MLPSLFLNPQNLKSKADVPVMLKTDGQMLDQRKSRHLLNILDNTQDFLMSQCL